MSLNIMIVQKDNTCYTMYKEKTKCRAKGKHPVQNERKIPSIERKGKHTVMERDAIHHLTLC